MRWGWPERVGGLGRIEPAARLSRRGAHLPGPGRAGHLLHDRGPGADDDRLRHARAGRRPWCRGSCGATRPGARASPSPGRGATWPRCRAGPPGPATAGASRARRSGPAWPSTPSAACCSPAPARRTRPTGASPPCSSTWTARASRCGRSRRCTAPPSSPRSSSTTSLVPLDRTLGDEGQGWSVAMDLLPYERSTALWHRAAYLQQRLQGLLEAAPAGALDPADVGEVAQLLFALRARSRATQRRLAAGERLGPETSIDKVLVATAEQAVFDLVADGLSARAWASVTTRPASAGGGSTSTRAPPPSTAGRRRSSGTSSPAGCSTSGPTADGPRRAGRVRAGPAPRRRGAHRRGARCRPRSSSGGPTPWRRTRRTAVSIFFELQGSAHASSSALDQVLACSIGLDVAAGGRVRAAAARAAGARRASSTADSLVVRGLGTAVPARPVGPPWSSPRRSTPSWPSACRPPS